MGETNIEWADAVWNPVRGCTRVSEGCRNCYAEAMAARFTKPGMAFEKYAIGAKAGPRWTGQVDLITEKLKEPLRWRKPRQIFVNSMSDLFHEKLSFTEDIAPVFKVMRAAAQHQFLVLTKRPARMLEFCKAWGEPLPNVWLGVSVEDQKTADERIPLLLQTPAAIRFVSYEPALGPVDFLRIQWPDKGGHRVDVLRGGYWMGKTSGFVNHSDFPSTLDWIIVGGESGPHARPFDIAWARSTVDQCRAAGVACFVKQLGANPQGDAPPSQYDPATRTTTVQVHQVVTIRDRKGGDMTEWPEDLRVREFPR